MKIAITSTGNSLESHLDQRFGRCDFFVIYDTETKGIGIYPKSEQRNSGRCRTEFSSVSCQPKCE